MLRETFQTNNLPEKSGDELVADYLKNKDERTFVSLYNKYHPQVAKTISSMVKDKQVAENLTQDLFVKLQGLILKSKYEGKGAFGGWLNTVTKNLTRDYLRENNNEVSAPGRTDVNDLKGFLEITDNNSDPEKALMNKEILEKFEENISKLSEEKQKIIRLFLEGYKYAEIAEQLSEFGVTEPGARLVFHRFKNEMQEKMREFRRG